MANWKLKLSSLERNRPVEIDPIEMASLLAQMVLRTVANPQIDYEAQVVRWHASAKTAPWHEVVACYLDRPSPGLGLERLEYFEKHGTQRDDVNKLIEEFSDRF